MEVGLGGGGRNLFKRNFLLDAKDVMELKYIA
jgi:hypothetical protein